MTHLLAATLTNWAKTMSAYSTFSSIFLSVQAKPNLSNQSKASIQTIW